VARNRKRAKERRARSSDAPGVAITRARQDAPEPLEHATAGADLAEAQLAIGRPELAGEELEGPADDDGARDDEGEYGEDEALEAGGDGPSGGGGGRDDEPDDDGADEGHEPAAHLPARRPSTASRLVTFIQGSWRELQRVQWPDRRQVMQATGVVIGFVIVAGAYLGLADGLAGKIVNLILK
jgi:preprotein translocase SecE subunit